MPSLGELPVDILFIVSELLEPNPITYSELSTVSKNFHTAFTSDKVWAALNPYGIEREIYKHFLDTIDDDFGEYIRYAWSHICDEAPCCDNLYVWLGCLTRVLWPTKVKICTSNKALMECALKIDGRAIFAASKKLKVQKTLALLAVTRSGCAIKFLSEELRNNHAILEAAMKSGCGDTCSKHLAEVRKSLPSATFEPHLQPLQICVSAQDNFNLVRHSVRARGETLAFASLVLRSNYNIVLEAVSQDGLALKHSLYLGPKAKNLEIIKAAISQDVKAIKFVSPLFINERQVLLLALEQCESLRFLSDMNDGGFSVQAKFPT